MNQYTFNSNFNLGLIFRRLRGLLIFGPHDIVILGCFICLILWGFNHLSQGFQDQSHGDVVPKLDSVQI